MIEIVNVSKTYRMGPVSVEALRDVTLTIRGGEFLAVMGPSGSGKSTLMNILGCLDRPSEGTYRIDGQEVGGLGRDALAAIRSKKIGFVFQGFNLLPRMTALENVELPMIYDTVPSGVREERAREALAALGILDREHHLPSQMSGGQQQRVAAARAVVGDPLILLADEPTGNLDSTNGEAVMDLLRELHAEGSTILMVTHDPRYSRYAQRTIHLFDGRIVEESSTESQAG